MFGILGSLGSSVDWRAPGYLYRRLRVWGIVQVCGSAKDKTQWKRGLNILRHSLQYCDIGVPEPCHNFVSFIWTGDLKLVPSPWELWRRSRSRDFLFAALRTVWVQGCGCRTQGWCRYKVSILQTEILVLALARGEVFACRVSPAKMTYILDIYSTTHLTVHILCIFHLWFDSHLLFILHHNFSHVSGGPHLWLSKGKLDANKQEVQAHLAKHGKTTPTIWSSDRVCHPGM